MLYANAADRVKRGHTDLSESCVGFSPGLFVLRKYRLRHHLPGLRIQRMDDILVLAVGSTFGRHGYKAAVRAFYYLDVVDHEAVVDSYGRHGFKLPFFLFDQSYTNFRDVHCLPLPVSSIFERKNLKIPFRIFILAHKTDICNTF